jgi:hypothetical protein
MADNSITGARTVIGCKVAPTFGTAIQCVAGDRMEVLNFTHGENAEELQSSPIGSGDLAASDARRGATSPGWTAEKEFHSAGPEMAWRRQFYGNEYVNYAGVAGAASHSFVFNEFQNQSWLTGAFELASATGAIAEYPSGTLTKLSVLAENPPSYLKTSCEVLADRLVTSGQVNAITSLDYISKESNVKFVFQPSDEFLINVQSSGALATPTDRINVTSVAFDWTKDQEHVREAKGSAGNGQPVLSGTPPLNWDVTITLARNANMDWYLAQQAGTEYKAQLSIIGPLISGAVYHKYTLLLPRLKIISDVDYNPSSAATNPIKITFKGLVASSIPAGMLDIYPSEVVINTRLTGQS